MASELFSFKLFPFTSKDFSEVLLICNAFFTPLWLNIETDYQVHEFSEDQCRQC